MDQNETPVQDEAVTKDVAESTPEPPNAPDTPADPPIGTPQAADETPVGT